MTVHISTHDGKLKGMRSISTSVLSNPLCKKRREIDGSVCGICYACRMEGFRESLRENLEENSVVLRRPLKDHDIPRFDDRFFRIESFGDCSSVTQAVNYVKIALANPKTRFGVWTKNLSYYKKAFDKLGKPDNLVLVYSSLMIGKTGSIPDEYRHIVDHRFTVMPKDTPRERINCGGRKCLECLRCYYKNTSFDVYEIEK